MRATPEVVDRSEADRVIDELCDPERRLAIVVAAAPDGGDPRGWLGGTTGRVFRHLPGLAVMYVLSAGATARFNREPEFHRVYGGGIRTFLPGLDPAWQDDSGSPQRLAAGSPLPELLEAVACR